jgi:hypothetical protein
VEISGEKVFKFKISFDRASGADSTLIQAKSKSEMAINGIAYHKDTKGTKKCRHHIFLRALRGTYYRGISTGVSLVRSVDIALVVRNWLFGCYTVAIFRNKIPVAR